MRSDPFTKVGHMAALLGHKFRDLDLGIAGRVKNVLISRPAVSASSAISSACSRPMSGSAAQIAAVSGLSNPCQTKSPGFIAGNVTKS
jgi:hypothetical protein